MKRNTEPGAMAEMMSTASLSHSRWQSIPTDFPFIADFLMTQCGRLDYGAEVAKIAKIARADVTPTKQDVKIHRSRLDPIIDYLYAQGEDALGFSIDYGLKHMEHMAHCQK